MLWTDDKLKTELDKAEQWADTVAVIVEMRNEYEAALAKEFDRSAELESIVEAKSEYIAELERDVEASVRRSRRGA